MLRPVSLNGILPAACNAIGQMEVSMLRRLCQARQLWDWAFMSCSFPLVLFYTVNALKMSALALLRVGDREHGPAMAMDAASRSLCAISSMGRGRMILKLSQVFWETHLPLTAM